MRLTWSRESGIGVDGDTMRAHAGVHLLSGIGDGHGFRVLYGHVAFNAAVSNRGTQSAVASACPNLVAGKAVAREGGGVFLSFMDVVARGACELARSITFALLQRANLVSVYIYRCVEGGRSDLEVVTDIVSDYECHRGGVSGCPAAMAKGTEAQLLIAGQMGRVHDGQLSRASLWWMRRTLACGVQGAGAMASLTVDT